MTPQDLKHKYGGANNRTLIKRAIRSEIAGGNQCLDALNDLDYLAQQWRGGAWPAAEIEIKAALTHLYHLSDLMRAEIRRRYQLPKPQQEIDR